MILGTSMLRIIFILFSIFPMEKNMSSEPTIRDSKMTSAYPSLCELTTLLVF